MTACRILILLAESEIVGFCHLCLLVSYQIHIIPVKECIITVKIILQVSITDESDTLFSYAQKLLLQFWVRIDNILGLY